MEKLEEAKKILQSERKITPEKLALKLNISVSSAYHLFKLLREWCNETGQCEEVKENKKSMLVWKEEAQPQYKLIEKNDKVEIYEVKRDIDVQKFLEQLYNAKINIIEQSRDGKIFIFHIDKR